MATQRKDGTTWGPRRPKLSWSLIEHVRSDASRLGHIKGKGRTNLAKKYHISGSTYWWITRGWSNTDVPKELLEQSLVSFDTLEEMRNTFQSFAEQEERDAETENSIEAVERSRVFRCMCDVLDRAMTKRTVHDGQTR